MRTPSRPKIPNLSTGTSTAKHLLGHQELSIRIRWTTAWFMDQLVARVHQPRKENSNDGGNSNWLGLRGFARVNAILETITLVRKHSNFDATTMHPIMKLNCTIFAVYVNYIIEDESTDTRTYVCGRRRDELVRGEAENAFGAPISLHRLLRSTVHRHVVFVRVALPPTTFVGLAHVRWSLQRRLETNDDGVKRPVWRRDVIGRRAAEPRQPTRSVAESVSLA